MENQTTEELLKTALEAAVDEHPLNRGLHRALSSCINRFFKSKDNLEFTTSTLKVTQTANVDASTEGAKSPAFVPYIPGAYKEQKKTTSGPSFRPKTVAGRGIDETAKSIEEMMKEDEEAKLKAAEEANPEGQQSTDQDPDSNETDETDQNTDLNENDPPDFSGQNTGNEFLDMSTDEYLKFYGSLSDLKKFAKETLLIEFARNATADTVVELIKQKIADDTSKDTEGQ